MSQDSLSEFDDWTEPETEEAEPAEADEGTEEPVEEEAQYEPEEEAEPEPEPQAADRHLSRIEALEKRNDELTRLLLDRAQRPEEEPEDDPEINPEVEELVKPLLDKRLAGIEDVIQERRQEQQMNQLEGMAPGFRERWPEIQKAYDKLPDDLKPQFDSMTGALALDGIVRSRTSKSPAVGNSLKRRAHSESRPIARKSGGKAMTEDDVRNMTDAEFNRFVEAQTNGPGRSEGIDPLLR